MAGKKRPGKETVLLYVPAELKEAFRTYAMEDGRSMTNFIVKLMQDYHQQRQKGENI